MVPGHGYQVQCTTRHAYICTCVYTCISQCKIIDSWPLLYMHEASNELFVEACGIQYVHVVVHYYSCIASCNPSFMI